MSIRVIAGTAKGRQLKLVPGDSTRPIMDRVKESLFNIIGRDILDARFLDLFAGTGSVAIEALSRGAESALLLDLDSSAIRTINDNLKLTGFTDRAIVRKMDAFALLRQKPDLAYDFIYIAPPQYKDLWLAALRAVDQNLGWLHTEGEVIVQVDPTEYQPIMLDHLLLSDERRYGNTLLPVLPLDGGRITLVADMQKFEAVVKELLDIYNVTAPPIPIEQMLQHPDKDMWDDVDMNYVTSTFLSMSTPYSPRMSLARFLVRHIADSPWGEKRDLDGVSDDETSIHAFARVMTMPRELVMEISPSSRTPEMISLHFEVPEEDARQRLKELAAYAR